MPRIIADGQPAGAGGGATTGDISLQVPFVEDWGTGPTAGTKGNFNTLDFDPSTDNGVKFDFKVPDDYDSGDLTLYTTYAMSTAVASPNNQIRVQWEADIIDVSGGSIDTTSYPTTGATQTVPDNSTNVTRENVGSIVITAGDFEAGDTIQFRVRRDADHADDDHTGDWQVIGFDLSYSGQVATREYVQHIQLFEDTDETAPASGTKGNFGTLDYSSSADNEQKFTFVIPDHWDGFSDVHVRATYAMSSTNDGNVVVETEGQVADVSSGSLDTISVQKFILSVPADSDPHRTIVVKSIPAAAVSAGDSVVLKLARRAGTDADDTASDTWQVINVSVATGVGPKTGFESVTITENYLFAHDFEVQAGSPSAEQISPDFSNDFETYMKMTGNGASEQVDVSFQGRLRSDQSSITSIKIPVKGATSAAEYFVKIYVDNTLPATPAYSTPSGPVSAPTSRTLITLTDSDLSKQPIFTGGYEGRYFVVVEAHLDSGEILYVGRPFVKQE